MAETVDATKNGAEVKTGTEPEAQVTITQTKIDELINKGYGRGANKASEDLIKSLGVESIEQVKELIKAQKEAKEASKTDLQKATDNINALTKTIADLEGANKKLTSDMAIDKFATENGIKDVDYYRHLRSIASKDEKFIEETFIENLKSTKPFLFDKAAAKKIDASTNPETTALGEEIKKATTMAEIYALQKKVKA